MNIKSIFTLTTLLMLAPMVLGSSLLRRGTPYNGCLAA